MIADGSSPRGIVEFKIRHLREEVQRIHPGAEVHESPDLFDNLRAFSSMILDHLLSRDIPVGDDFDISRLPDWRDRCKVELIAEARAVIQVTTGLLPAC